jgi:hypothetical protein
MESRPRILVASSPRHMIAAGARADTKGSGIGVMMSTA